MHDTLIMSECEALSALDEDIDNEGQGIPCDRVLITFCDAVKNVTQIPALKFLHREVGIAFGISAEFIDGDGAGVWNLSGDASFSEEAFLIGLEVLELRLEGFHDHGAPQVFVNACAQDGLTALSEGIEIPVPHEAISDVLGKVPIGIGHQNIIGQDSTSSGNLKAATASVAENGVGLETHSGVWKAVHVSSNCSESVNSSPVEFGISASSLLLLPLKRMLIRSGTLSFRG